MIKFSRFCDFPSLSRIFKLGKEHKNVDGRDKIDTTRMIDQNKIRETSQQNNINQVWPVEPTRLSSLGETFKENKPLEMNELIKRAEVDDANKFLKNHNREIGSIRSEKSNSVTEISNESKPVVGNIENKPAKESFGESSENSKPESIPKVPNPSKPTEIDGEIAVAEESKPKDVKEVNDNNKAKDEINDLDKPKEVIEAIRSNKPKDEETDSEETDSEATDANRPKDEGTDLDKLKKVVEAIDSNKSKDEETDSENPKEVIEVTDSNKPTEVADENIAEGTQPKKENEIENVDKAVDTDINDESRNIVVFKF